MKPLTCILLTILLSLCQPTWANVDSGQPPASGGGSTGKSANEASGKEQPHQVAGPVDYFTSPAPSAAFTDYTPRRGYTQQDCPVLWCADRVSISLLDGKNNNFIPGTKSGYLHLRVQRQPKAVLLVNDRPHRVMFLFSINGKNPVDGKKAVMSSRGYIVPARSELLVEATKLEDQAWFSPSWPREGRISINVYNETATRPIDGGPPPLAPPEARQYLVENGKRYWVPPHDFPFRYAGGRVVPASTLFLTYDISIP